MALLGGLLLAVAVLFICACQAEDCGTEGALAVVAFVFIFAISAPGVFVEMMGWLPNLIHRLI